MPKLDNWIFFVENSLYHLIFCITLFENHYYQSSYLFLQPSEKKYNNYFLYSNIQKNYFACHLS